jgi:hypothetical protein
MAVVYNGTRNELPARQLPDDYERPVVAAVVYEYTRTLNLSVAKATVDEADAATTMENILADAAIGLNKQIQDILAAEFLGSANVTAYGELVRLENNYQSMDKDSPALTTTAAAYLATVKIYVRAA